MTSVERWLEQATRGLASESAAVVRGEIREHYESERESWMSRGATSEEAGRLAVKALGDARDANCEYRKVLLTSAEAGMLRESNWEARAICSRPWLKWTLLTVPVAALAAGSVLFFSGPTALAQGLVLMGIATGVVFAGPFLPIYTERRGRVYRIVKWMVLISAFCLAFGSDAVKYSWLWASCLWIPFWTEWTRASIRRKLPVGQWPKQLYL